MGEIIDKVKEKAKDVKDAVVDIAKLPAAALLCLKNSL